MTGAEAISVSTLVITVAHMIYTIVRDFMNRIVVE